MLKHACKAILLWFSHIYGINDSGWRFPSNRPIYRSGSTLNSVNAEVVDGIHMASKTSVNDCNIEIQEFWVCERMAVNKQIKPVLPS